MAYTALYRKFRPQTFESVIGQEHIVRTLKNQMKTGRVSHAYLFCGTRGTGKTSTAKIFARAINCTNPTADGEPCNECAVCKDILAGRSVNVIEIDAASNNGVDNIREIREEVKYPPTQGKYKVYIIDEVTYAFGGGVQCASENTGGAACTCDFHSGDNRPTEGAGNDSFARTAV